MFNPIAMEAVSRALQRERMAAVEAARRAGQVRRRRRRHNVQTGYMTEPGPSLGMVT